MSGAKGYFTPKHFTAPAILISTLLYTNLQKCPFQQSACSSVSNTSQDSSTYITVLFVLSNETQIHSRLPEAMEFGLLFLPEHQHYIYNQPQNRKKHSRFQIRCAICKAYLM